MVRASTLLIAAALCALLFVGLAWSQQTPKEVCQLCEQINMGSKKGGKYICPNDVMKKGECSINLNGWCCQDTRRHPKCKACFDLEDDNNDNDDEEDEEEEM